MSDRNPDHFDELVHWEALAPDLVAGDRLLHTDLHQGQFLIDRDATVRIIDWARPASGAAWVDLAFLVIRLVGAGHSPADAERWASQVPTWKSATAEALTAFAVYVAGLWSHRSLADPDPGAERRATMARRYAHWRLRLLEVR